VAASGIIGCTASTGRPKPIRDNASMPTSIATAAPMIHATTPRTLARTGPLCQLWS
jgi:hypothetical protein